MAFCEGLISFPLFSLRSACTYEKCRCYKMVNRSNGNQIDWNPRMPNIVLTSSEVIYAFNLCGYETQLKRYVCQMNVNATEDPWAHFVKHKIDVKWMLLHRKTEEHLRKTI